MSSTPVRTVAPATSPVSLAWAKQHLRVTSDDEDALIEALISAAVSHLDGWSGTLRRCLVTQTWRQDYSEFSDDGLELPFSNVQSAVVAYTDTDSTTQTLAEANYHITNTASGAIITLADGASWPGTAVRPDAVRVTFVAGYGTADDVPEAIQAAILLHVGHLYVNRDSNAQMPMAHEALIAPYRRMVC